MSKPKHRKDAACAEFQGLELGHGRRTARGKRFMRALSVAPHASLPRAMKTEADLEGAYRHLSNESVDADAILAPHIAATAARVDQEKVAYVLHDTTSFVFGGDSPREGLGHVNSKIDQGFRGHISLAIKTDGFTPLGVLTAQTIVRTGKAENRPNEAKRWLENIISCNEQVKDASRIIHIADRESDIYEVLAHAQEHGWRYIFRAAQNRRVSSSIGESKVFEVAATRQSMFKRHVNLSKRLDAGKPAKQKKAFPSRGAREAALCFSATTLQIQRPQRGSVTLPKQVALNIVRVWEPAPPKGETPIEWVLLTSERVNTRREILAVVDGYRARWLIEVFFNALKSGCSFEQRQLESARSLINLLSYCLVIAYVLLLHRAILRTDIDCPASYILTQQQIKCLRIMSEGKLPARATAKEALAQIAILGAHLKRNGPPGWRVLSRGWQDLLQFEATYELIQAAQNK